jgi:hypothetical protein
VVGSVVDVGGVVMPDGVGVGEAVAWGVVVVVVVGDGVGVGVCVGSVTSTEVGSGVGVGVGSADAALNDRTTATAEAVRPAANCGSRLRCMVGVHFPDASTGGPSWDRAEPGRLLPTP